MYLLSPTDDAVTAELFEFCLGQTQVVAKDIIGVLTEIGTYRNINDPSVLVHSSRLSV